MKINEITRPVRKRVSEEASVIKNCWLKFFKKPTAARLNKISKTTGKATVIFNRETRYE